MKIKIENERIMVRMLDDQSGADFGDRKKGEEFEMVSELAKLHERRGILKIIKQKGKNGDE